MAGHAPRHRLGHVVAHAGNFRHGSLTQNDAFMSADSRYERMVEALDPTPKPRPTKPVTIRRFSWEAGQ